MNQSFFTAFFIILISSAAMAHVNKMECEVLKNGTSTKNDLVKISFTEPTMKRVKTIVNSDGSISTKTEEFITEDFVTSYKIARPFSRPCTSTLNDTNDEYYFYVGCFNVNAYLSVDFKNMQGDYYEGFKPTNTSRTIQFAKCAEDAD